MTRRFEVDDEGFKRQMLETPPFRIVQEIIANSFDEDSVSTITCVVEAKGRELVSVLVEDDGAGFNDIAESYTLFAVSKKRNDPSKRGRFNLGEKQFFVLAEEGYVESKNYRVSFSKDGRNITEIPERKGTKVYAEIAWKSSVVPDILHVMYKLIVPEGKRFFVNNTEVQPRTKLRTLTKCGLPTLIEGEKGILTRTVRNTEIILYQKEESEKAWLYELGIPVQKLGMGVLWIVDVQQKIPLPTNRSVVSESYLKSLHGHLVNGAYDLLSGDTSTNKFVSDGLATATETSYKAVMMKRYNTENIAIPSTTDYNANELALEAGAFMLHNGDLDRESRTRGTELGIIYKTVDKFKTLFTVGTSKQKIEDETEVTDFIRTVVQKIALDTIQKEVSVKFINDSGITARAYYGDDSVTFNTYFISIDKLRRFDAEVIALVIHELAHDKYGLNEGFAHLKHNYVDEVLRIAGIIAFNGIKHYLVER